MIALVLQKPTMHRRSAFRKSGENGNVLYLNVLKMKTKGSIPLRGIKPLTH